jgi:hypothetical protein
MPALPSRDNDIARRKRRRDGEPLLKFYPSVGSHLGLRILNFASKKPSNGVCLTFRAGWFDRASRR